jgi:hypothetical protein
MILGGCVVLGAAAMDAGDAMQPPLGPVRVAPEGPAGPLDAQPVARLTARPLAPEPDVVQQMQALERTVRFDMLLYMPARTSSLHALALTVASR